MGIKMSVAIGRLKMKNPVMVASGTWGAEYLKLADAGKLGAVVLKTVTLNARTGNVPPRVCETASGMLNSIGLENKGVYDFMTDKLTAVNKIKTNIIVSIAGDDKDEFGKLAATISRSSRVDGLELNLSCPNVKHGISEGLIAHNEKAVYDIVKSVRRKTRLPVITKLSPNVTDIKVFARAAEAGGSDAIALTNTFIGMAVDINTRKPKLGNVTGGLSGPAIKPLALRAVWEAGKAIDIPIVGIGGIMDYKDAVEFMLCGATAVQIGTANFVDPAIPGAIVDGLERYASREHVQDIRKLIGAIRLG